MSRETADPTELRDKTSPELEEDLEDLALGEDYALNPDFVAMVVDAADRGESCFASDPAGVRPRDEGCRRSNRPDPRLLQEISGRAGLDEVGNVGHVLGEVTVQFAAAKRLLQRLKEEGIHTAIETNGAHRRLGELFPLVDCLIIDFKHHDDARLRAATGVGIEVIKRNLRKALAEHPDVLIRIPLIGGFNDASADAEQFAAFFRPLDTARARFEFLSYHEYGKDKWAQCGLPYRMERMKSAFVGNETVAQFQSVFAAAGLHVIHT